MSAPDKETDSLLHNGRGSGPKPGGNNNNFLLLSVGAICLLFGFGMGFFVHSPPPPPLEGPIIHRESLYTATQFISFSINTLGGLDEYGECQDRVVDDNGVCYLGNKDDLQEDLEHRFRILKEALLTLREDRLNETPEIDYNSNVLKIFMLPEFFLRGPNGAYSTKQILKGGIMNQYSDEIHTITDHDNFEDFLFVFGTVIAAQSPNDSRLPWEPEDQEIEKGEILYFNVAPISRGGSKHREVRYLIQKRYISSADFLDRSKGLPDPRRSHLSEYDQLQMDDGLRKYLTKERNYIIVSDNILNIDGIRIGVEICLDHRLGVLWDRLQKDKGDLVDVQLITSAGMAIERGPTPLRPGGVVYLTDGEGSSAACRRYVSDRGAFDPNTVCRDLYNKGPTGLKHVPNGGEGYSSYMSWRPVLNPDDTPWKPLLEGYYSNHATQGCAYTPKLHGIDVYDEYDFYPPSIEIYPTIDLP